MKFLELVHALQTTIKALQMYTDAHPRTQDGLNNLYQNVESWLIEKPTIHVATSGGKLVLDGALIESQNFHTSGLAKQLSDRQIGGFVFERGVTKQDLLGMLKILILKPSQLESLGGAAKVVTERQIDHVTWLFFSVQRPLSSQEMADQARNVGPVNQPLYKEVRSGPSTPEGGAQGSGESAETQAAQFQAVAPMLQNVANMSKRWKEGLDSGLLEGLQGSKHGTERAGENHPSTDLDFLAPIAEEMGWGSGFPTAPQIEALRQALQALPSQTLLTMLGELASLPETPPSLSLAFQALAPELLGQATSNLLQTGTSWDGLKDPLFELIKASPQKEAMLASLEAQFENQGLEPEMLKELLRQMDWDNQSLAEKVHRATTESALWNLSQNQRLSLLRDLLDQDTPEAFLQMLELFLEQLTSDDPHRRDEAAKGLVSISEWLEDPGLPMEAQGPLLQGLVAHFGWEPRQTIHSITAETLGHFLAYLVNHGEMPQAQQIVQELEGLFAFTEDNHEWRGLALAGLRDGLLSQRLMTSTLNHLHTVGAEEMLATIIPYFEFLGEPAAKYLVAVLGEEPDRKRRGRLLEVIRAMGPMAIPALQEGICSPTWYFVRNTLNLMADTGDAGLLEDITTYLHHTDARVRSSAVRAMWKLGGPAAGPSLLECLLNAAPETQIEILFGLGQIQAFEAVPNVLELVKNTKISTRLRIKAIETFGQIASPAAIPGLLELIRRKGHIFTTAESTDIRMAGARALLAIGTPQATLEFKQIVDKESRNQDRDAFRRILEMHQI